MKYPEEFKNHTSWRKINPSGLDGFFKLILKSSCFFQMRSRDLNWFIKE